MFVLDFGMGSIKFCIKKKKASSLTHPKSNLEFARCLGAKLL